MWRLIRKSAHLLPWQITATSIWTTRLQKQVHQQLLGRPDPYWMKRPTGGSATVDVAGYRIFITTYTFANLVFLLGSARNVMNSSNMTNSASGSATPSTTGSIFPKQASDFHGAK